MAAPQQPDRAVHLGEQSGDRRLARARIPEEDEVLARRDLRQAVLLAPRLHLEERHQRAHLLLDRLEPDQRTRRLGSPERAGQALLDLGPRRLAEALADDAEALEHVLKRIGHAGTVPSGRCSEAFG